jgi:hypothetical protein
LIYRLQLLQTYRQRVSVAKDKLIVCEFDEAAIRFIIPGTTEVTYTWNAFTSVFEKNGVLTLFIQKAAFHTIPKSALTDADFAELKRIVAIRQEKP